MDLTPVPARLAPPTTLRREQDAAGKDEWRIDVGPAFLSSPCAILEVEELLRLHPEAAQALCETALGRALHKLVIQRL